MLENTLKLGTRRRVPKSEHHPTDQLTLPAAHMSNQSASPVLERLRSFLQANEIAFQETHHAAVFTSEEAAAVRGAPLASGAKALVVKAGDGFTLLVIPADRKLDSKRAKHSLGVKDLRFASKDELMALTSLQPGAVPPFGSLFGLTTHVDPALATQPRINFNAGEHTASISMTWNDYLRAEHPQLAALTA
jgi:Ala-tRNA(Pro) deacylase